MGLLEQVKANRSLVSNLQAKSEQDTIEQYRKAQRCPVGFFSPDQLFKFQQFDAIFHPTVVGFMGEIGIERFSVLRVFNTWRYETAVSREVGYLLSFGGDINEKPYVHQAHLARGGEMFGVSLVYRPERHGVREGIKGGEKLCLKHHNGCVPMESWRQSADDECDIDDVLRLFGSKSSHNLRLCYTTVVTRDLTESGIRKMLTVVASDPRLDALTSATAK